MCVYVLLLHCLKTISVIPITNITDEAFVKLAEGCRELEGMDLRGCDKLTNESVLTFSSSVIV